MEGIVLESVWVAVGFIVFVALIWRRVGAAVGGMLDDRSQKIRQDLDEARALRDEALEELHQFQRLHRQRICPLNVIEDHHQRTVFGNLLKG